MQRRAPEPVGVTVRLHDFEPQVIRRWNRRRPQERQ